MRIHKFLLKTHAEGPGIRACIWVQGCNHHCKGCFSKHTWDYNGGSEYSVSDVIKNIEKVIDEIDGVTFLGGEPFDQADELGEIAKYFKSRGKNIISFTGYTYEQLQADIKYKSLLENTDLLCDGEFEIEKTDFSRPLVGSSNQRMIYLSDAISSEQMLNYKNRFEIRINNNGLTEINGMGNITKIKEYLKEERGITNGITNI